MFRSCRAALYAAVAWSLAGGLLAPGAVSAQEAPTSEASSIQGQDDVAALVERMEALKPLADAERRARKVARGMETGLAVARFPVGPLSVVAREDQRAAISWALEQALPFYATTVRGGSELVLSEGDWMVQFHDGYMPADLGVWAEGGESIEVQTTGDSSRMVMKAREVLGQRLVGRLPTRFREWAGGSPLVEPGTSLGYGWSELHRIAVSAGSSAVRDCLAGAAERCWSVLGFPQTESVLNEWYTPEEIRLRALLSGQITLRGRRGFRRGDRSVDRERLKEFRRSLAACRKGDIDACLGEYRPTMTHSSPLPVIARNRLVWHALERGGEGAYARLVEAVEGGASIPEALGAAAGESPSTLVVSWGRRVAQARPVTQEDLKLAGVSSLFWLLSFAGLAVFAAQRRSV